MQKKRSKYYFYGLNSQGFMEAGVRTRGGKILQKYDCPRDAISNEEYKLNKEYQFLNKNCYELNDNSFSVINSNNSPFNEYDIRRSS